MPRDTATCAKLGGTRKAIRASARSVHAGPAAARRPAATRPAVSATSKWEKTPSAAMMASRSRRWLSRTVDVIIGPRGVMRVPTLSTVLVVVLGLMVSLRAQAPQRGGRGNVDLPEGAGKQQVQGYCQSCHTLGNIVNSGGYTREGWSDLIGTMIKLPPDQHALVIDYLAKNFPEQPRPKPVLIAGPVKVTFKD